MEWIWCVCREKSRYYFVARAFALTALVHPVLHRFSCGYETIPNAAKHYATHQQMSLGSNGVDSVRWLQKKSLRDFVAPTFALIAPVHTVLHRVLCSYETIKSSQTLAPKHEFRVQWGGLGAFVAKNPDVTSWHELLY